MKKNKEDIEDKVYLYVHAFEWNITSDKKHFKGHLEAGRVYQALKEIDEDGEFYTIDLFEDNYQPNGILLGGLVGKFRAYSCDIVELTEELILDLDITEDDMAMIALDTSHYKKEGDRKSVLATVDNDEIIPQITKILKELDTIDPDMVKFFLLLVGSTTETLANDKYVTLTGHLSSTHNEAGRVANVTLATASLEAHLNSENNNPTNLLNAVFSILLELKRTIKLK